MNPRGLDAGSVAWGGDAAAPLTGPESALLRAALGREDTLLAEDVATRAGELRAAIGGARVLVIGAAGSIGAALTRALLDYRPHALTLVDLDENGLAELVREARSGHGGADVELTTHSVDYTSDGFARLLASRPPFDYVLSCAALKHVRAERDVFSAMRMLDTNVVALARLGTQLGEQGQRPRLFSVSSDKAVLPHSLMGASKALMESALWAAPGCTATTTRFANVAFSNGSLLHGFLQRLRKGQPISGPSDIARFFISEREAARLCLLSGFLGQPNSVLVPRLARDCAVPIADVAVAILAAHGLTPLPCDSAEEARARAAERGLGERTWPCYFTPASTSGEKPCEAFIGPGESSDAFGFADALVVTPSGDRAIHAERLAQALSALAQMRARPRWDKAELVAIVRDAVPGFDHRETGHNLDEGM